MPTKSYAVIGAGPSGLAAMRALQKLGLDATGYESSAGVGGLWDIANPRSTVYASAHLISSRTTTEFADFPMDPTADYPGHRALKHYLDDYADAFGLREGYRFDTTVEHLEPAGDGWVLHATRRDEDGTISQVTARHDAVILANGTLSAPRLPEIPGEFSGEILHSSAYKDPALFEGRRVLIVGAGNSGCDIAVDAVHRAASVELSVRRGAHFVPRYLFGRPSDTLNRGRPLPARLKQAIDSRVLRAFTGDPVRFGFPKPDHRLYEAHPIVNTLVLHHLGQGDLRVRADVERFDGSTVHFRDGSRGEYDLVLLATGYRLDYPFVDREHLNWEGEAPRLFLNVFPPSFDGLYVVGMIEATGIGWQGRYEQAELVAEYLAAEEQDPPRAERFRRRVAEQPWPDLRGGYRYAKLPRMAYYVNKDAYRRAATAERRALRRPVAPGAEAPAAGERGR